MSKKLTALIMAGVLLVAAVLFFRMGNIGTGALWSISNEGSWLLPLVLVAALIDSINPCAFGILLLTVAFLLSIGKARLGILKIGGAYVMGILAVYFLIGLGILQALHLFNTPHFMAKLGAGLLIVLGAINLISEFFPSFPLKPRIPHAAHKKMAELMEKASIPTAFVLGALVGLCEFPCTGGPYLMVIGLLHDNATYLTGVGYLVLYNLIFIIPLVLVLAIASDGSLIEKVQAWKRGSTRGMRLWGSIAMVALGISIFFL